MQKPELKAGLRYGAVLVLLTCLVCPVLATQAWSREARVAEVQNIARLYMAAFDRFPEVSGFNHWIEAWEAGQSIQGIADAFYRSPEFSRTFGSLSDQEYVETLFTNILGRRGSDREVETWLEALASGESRAGLLLGFTLSAENVRNSAATVSGVTYHDYAQGGYLPKSGKWIFLEDYPQPGEVPAGGAWYLYSGDPRDLDFSVPSEPVQVSADLRFTSIAAGYYHNCAIATTGDTYCWGNNKYGQLGSTHRMKKCGALACSATPVPVDGGHPFTQVVAGRAHSCGLEASGNAYCWGGGASGQLGDGRGRDSAVPVPVSGGLRFRTLAANATSASTCGLTEDGAAWCWGSNRSGVLGIGTDEPNVDVPTRVMTDLAFDAISISDRTGCAVSAEGDAYCWGDNRYGQLGVAGGIRGGVASSNAPVAVPGGEKFVQVQTDGSHSCALQASGAVYCWGIHSTTGWYPVNTARFSPGFNFLPARVGPPDAPWASGSGAPWILLGVGDGQTCALAKDGELDCWGNDVVDPRAWGPYKAENPIPVGGDNLFSTFSSGGFHDCAVNNEGFAYCWGSNAWAQLGRAPHGDRY